MQAILLTSSQYADLLRRALGSSPRIRELRSTERLMEFLQWAHMDKPDLLIMEAGLALSRIHSMQSRLPPDVPALCIGAEVQLTEIRRLLPTVRGVTLNSDAAQLSRKITEALSDLSAPPASSGPAPKPSASAPPRPVLPPPVITPRPVESYQLRPLPLGLFRPRALAIGSSTGGPHALLEVFKALKGHIPNIPIFITQHMPPKFTRTLAQQLQDAAGVPGMEAEDGMTAKPAHIYVAPGDYHMTVQEEDGKQIIRLNQNPPENFCRPSVDVMLRSLSPIYQQNLLVVILTGMGSDGVGGARICTEKNARLIGQDQMTSVVWGMPKAVAEAGICNAIQPLGQIAPMIREWCGS